MLLTRRKLPVNTHAVVNIQLELRTAVRAICAQHCVPLIQLCSCDVILSSEFIAIVPTDRLRIHVAVSRNTVVLNGTGHVNPNAVPHISLESSRAVSTIDSQDRVPVVEIV